MPVYVYKNLNTGERFEIEQRITEPPLEEHPETGEPVKRLVQPVGIAFKGSGFYATDSRGTSAKKGSSNGAAEGAGKDASSSDTSSSDASKDAGKTSSDSAVGSKATGSKPTGSKATANDG